MSVDPEQAVGQVWAHLCAPGVHHEETTATAKQHAFHHVDLGEGMGTGTETPGVGHGCEGTGCLHGNIEIASAAGVVL